MKKIKVASIKETTEVLLEYFAHINRNHHLSPTTFNHILLKRWIEENLEEK